MITLAQAKRQVRVTHDQEDVEIQEMIDSATVAIMGYIDASVAETFVSTDGQFIEDTNGEATLVPADIKMACKLEVAHLYRNREGQSESKIPDQFGYGYALCAAAIGKLYRYRTPVIA